MRKSNAKQAADGAFLRIKLLTESRFTSKNAVQMPVGLLFVGSQVSSLARWPVDGVGSSALYPVVRFGRVRGFLAMPGADSAVRACCCSCGGAQSFLKTASRGAREFFRELCSKAGTI